MAGHIFEHESCFHPEACKCIIARDESDHSTPDKHLQSSQYVFQCAAHKQAGSTAVEAFKHNASKWAAIEALKAQLPDDAWEIVPPEEGGGKRLKELIDCQVDFKAGTVTINHPKVTKKMLDQTADVLSKHKHSALTLK